MISVKDMDPREPVFTFIEPSTQEEFSWAVQRLAEWANKHAETFITPVERIGALMFVRDRGIEQHRLERLDPACLLDPIVYLDWGDGTQLLLDGHHRYVYAAMNGFTEILAHMLTHEQVEPFRVEGIPPQGEYKLRNGYSGL